MRVWCEGHGARGVAEQEMVSSQAECANEFMCCSRVCVCVSVHMCGSVCMCVGVWQQTCFYCWDEERQTMCIIRVVIYIIVSAKRDVEHIKFLVH